MEDTSYNAAYAEKSLWGRIRRAYRRKGLGYTATAFFKNPWIYYMKPGIAAAFFAVIPKKKFLFRGKKYTYLARRYNSTWQNERAVEIPIALEAIKSFSGRRILEVGHVLGHYVPTYHDVIDKYETGPGIINEDAATFHPKELYDMIISVSTIEHIGWDEEPKDPESLLRAIKNLKENCLCPGGTLFVTTPFGWNPFLDECLASGKLTFDETYYLKRIGPGRDWTEAVWDEVKGTSYSHRIPTANAIVVGIIRN